MPGARTKERGLKVTGISSLDCALLPAAYPALTELSLSGKFGTIEHAGSLNQLPTLRGLYVDSLFGMSAQDCLVPGSVPALELLALHNVPFDYATAMRARWRPQIPAGTQVEISGARKPQ